MTMLSFRVDEEDAARAQAWAVRLGVDRSQLLREALRRHLLPLPANGDRLRPLKAVAAANWEPAG